MKPTASYHLLTVLLRLALLAALFTSGWFIYSRLPHQAQSAPNNQGQPTTLEVVLRPPFDNGSTTLDIPIDIYPFDIIAARHEYFTERRAGKPFDEFLSERMKGRKPVAAKLDKTGSAVVTLSPGSWWLHAQLPGDETLEWRLPLNVDGSKQTIELTPQNVYTRTRSF